MFPKLINIGRLSDPFERDQPAFFLVSLIGECASYTIGLKNLLSHTYLVRLRKRLYARGNVHRLAEIIQSILGIDRQSCPFVQTNFKPERAVLLPQSRIERSHLVHHLKGCFDAVEGR